MISLTIAGEAYPLNQISIRRDPAGGEISARLAGYAMLILGAECRVSVDGLPDIVGALISATIDERTTAITASLSAATGAGIWSPDKVQVRGSGMLRASLDYAVLPGDTVNGIGIESVTHTLSARGVGFTEARW